MTKPKTDKSELATIDNVPSYLTTRGAEGTERLEIQTTTPRLKVVQSMTDRDIKSEFGEGALICTPDNILVAEAGQPVTAVPVFRWVSWQTWADLKDKGQEMPVLDESFDPHSDLARKARNPNLRKEPYGAGFTMSHMECIHLILAIQDGPAAGLVAAYSFARAGHKHGAKVARYIDRNGEKGVPIYANLLSIGTMEETNRDNQTYFVLAAKPATPAFVTEDRLEAMRELYSGFSDLHATHSIQTASEASD